MNVLSLVSVLLWGLVPMGMAAGLLLATLGLDGRRATGSD